ncbi:MAG: TIGR02452 family protein [Deferribacteraceae bacterium]|jgi:uncharacterized protein (TIGR02452 family)|nr:TIGR02452 family protein [Deferribacteraceae bacterium]
MSKKTERATQAQKTLEHFQNATGELARLHQHSLASSRLYTPQRLDSAIAALTKPAANSAARIELTNEPVVSAIVRLKQESAPESTHIAVLNFASAKNPGGGFLNGALAQEESLAASSNLYLVQTLPQNMVCYEANRAFGGALYTDHMIYAKDALFVRQDTGAFWDTPLTVDVLTAPAVNYGAYMNHGGKHELALQTMKDRMRKVIQLFAVENARTLILGAYGCGVFQNDPRTVANFFVDILQNEGWQHSFERIVFAIFDRSKEQSVLKPFQDVFRQI